MKIKVCTMTVNDWYKEIVKYGVQTIRNYCLSNNYEFVIDDEGKATVYDKSRDPPWFKIKVLQKNLTDCDYCVWIDADSQILNPDKKIEYLIDTYLKDKDILIGIEGRSGGINTGVMIWRNCDYSHKILERIWNNEEDYRRDFHEQSSLQWLLDHNVDNLQERLVALPPYLQHELFSFWFMYFPESCFILHAARCSHDREGFIYTMDSYCPIKMDEESEEDYQSRMKWLKDSNLCRKDIDYDLAGIWRPTKRSARNKNR